MGQRNKTRKQNNSGFRKNPKHGKGSNRYDDALEKLSSKTKNDPAWYTKNPLLTKISTFVQQFLPLGQKLNLDQRSVITTRAELQAYNVIPGIMALYWLPTPGVSKDGTSEVSKAAASIFESMREKNFSTNIWDIPDLATYIFAWANAFLYYGYLTMVYAFARGYKFSNNYFPKGMAEALNVDRDDIIDNFANLEMAINIFSHIFEKSRVPKEISIVARWLHMSAEVYKDSPVEEKCQTYVFVPYCLGCYDATTGGFIQLDIGNKATKLKFNDLNGYMEQLTEALVYDDDFQIISADIQKYLGSESWKVNPVEPDKQLIPVYSEEMLWQIHNADFIPFASATGLLPSQEVVGLNTIFTWDPTFTAQAGELGGIEGKKIIDSKSDTMSENEVIESTRLKVLVHLDEDLPATVTDDIDYHIVKCGSEIITNARVFYTLDDGVTINSFAYKQYIATAFVLDSGTSIWSYPVKFLGNFTSSNKTRFSDASASLFYMHAFDYKPIQWLCNYGYSTTGKYEFVSFMGELDNYCVVEDSQIMAIHNQALLSEWNLLVAH